MGACSTKAAKTTSPRVSEDDADGVYLSDKGLFLCSWNVCHQRRGTLYHVAPAASNSGSPRERFMRGERSLSRNISSVTKHWSRVARKTNFLLLHSDLSGTREYGQNHSNSPATHLLNFLLVATVEFRQTSACITGSLCRRTGPKAGCPYSLSGRA
jgi:hypothetical protein